MVYMQRGLCIRDIPDPVEKVMSIFEYESALIHGKYLVFILICFSFIGNADAKGYSSPMPYLIVSDIHGSAEGIRLVGRARDHLHAEGIISAGDQCPSFPSPLWSSLISVRGNCDRFYEYMDMPFPPLYRTLRLYGRSITVTHGDRMWIDDFTLQDGDIFVSGHTHVPSLSKEGGVYLVNPGSPSRPRSVEGPTAALLEEDRLSLLSLLDLTVISSLSLSAS